MRYEIGDRIYYAALEADEVESYYREGLVVGQRGTVTGTTRVVSRAPPADERVQVTWDARWHNRRHIETMWSSELAPLSLVDLLGEIA